MNINGQYIPGLKEYLSNSSESGTTTQKSLVDYMNDKDGKGSSKLSDTLMISSSAISKLKDYNPEFLSTLMSSAEADSYSTSSGSALDSVQLSKEAYAALRESNPELLQALGYDIEEAGTK